jgi:hypothetical protein
MLNIVRVIKLKRTRWTWHVEWMSDKRNALKIQPQNLKGNKTLGRPRHKWVEFHCLVHNSRPLVPILRQTKSVHDLPVDLFKIYYSIILPPTLRSLKWPLSLSSPHQDPVCPSLPYMLHALPISSFLIGSFEWYTARSGNYQGPQDVIFLRLSQLPSCKAQTPASSQILSTSDGCDLLGCYAA